MDTVLQVLGAMGIIVCVVIVIAVVAIAILIFKVKRFLKTMAAGLTPTPQRIHLQASPDAKWADQAAFESNKRALSALGLTDLGTMTIAEMPGVLMRSYIKPSEGFLGILYEHPRVGQWVDLAKKYEDGGSITVTSGKTGHQLHHRPQHEKVYLREQPVEDLYKRLCQEPSDRRVQQLGSTPADFINLFETAYAEEMDWRNAQGGVTEAEIRQIAIDGGKVVSDETIMRTREISQQRACDGLQLALTEEFRTKRAIPEPEWNTVENKFLFVHNNLTPDMVKTILHNVGGNDHDLDEDYSHVLTSAPPREAFKSLIEKLHLAAKCRKVDELNKPIAADVYERN